MTYPYLLNIDNFLYDMRQGAAPSIPATVVNSIRELKAEFAKLQTKLLIQERHIANLEEKYRMLEDDLALERSLKEEHELKLSALQKRLALLQLGGCRLPLGFEADLPIKGAMTR